MANTQIDSLSLDIKVTGLNKDDIKNIDTLSKAVSRLTKSLKDADFSKLEEIKVPKGMKSIQLITQNFKNSFGSGNDETTKEDSGLDSVIAQIEDVSKAFSESSSEVEDGDLKIENATENVKSSLVGYISMLKKAKQELEGVGTGNKKAKKGLNGLQKFFKRFKTVAFIKAVRAILNAIVQAIQQGVTNLAGFDKEFNATMSRIKTSVTMIVNSLGLIVRPLIETLEPFVVSLAQSFAMVGNEVSRLQAIIKGTNKYTKINANYMEDFAKASQKASLFSFDTFNTLSDTSANNMFETVEVEGETTENEEKILSIVGKINTLIQNIVKLVKPIIKEILNLVEYLMPAIEILLDIVNEIIDALSPFIEDLLVALDPLFKVILQELLPSLLMLVNAILKPVLEMLRPILPLINQIISVLVETLVPIIDTISYLLDGISQVISFIFYFVKDTEYVANLLSGVITFWGHAFSIVGEQAKLLKNIIQDIFNMDWRKLGDDFGIYFKNLAKSLLGMIGTMIDSAINFIVDAINSLSKPIRKVAKKLNLDLDLYIDYRSDIKSKLTNFANGGIVGEIWQMNEYGNAEMLYSANNSGNTAVINQAQLSLAFEQAIYNTGLLEAIAQAGIINIDGKSIAQSKNFKAEINRTNPSLNIR